MQNSLFGNNAKRVDPPKAPPKQSGLFGNDVPVRQREAPKAPPAIWIPQIDDEINLININDGIEAVVTFVDMPNLHKEYFHPIHCRIPSLKNMMVYVRLDSAKLKRRP